MADVIIRVAPAGDLVEMKEQSVGGQVGGGVRGMINSFSRASRSRLMKLIATLKRDKLPLFVTLTYPDDFPVDSSVYKNHLDLFWRRLRYAYPDFGCIWKLEFQERGAAHYHFFLWGLTLEDAQAFVPGAWCGVVGSDDPNHLLWHEGKLGHENEHCVQPVKSWGGVKSYAGKYLSKLPEPDENGEVATGRVWGVRGAVYHCERDKFGNVIRRKKRRHNVPFSLLLEFRVDRAQAVKLRRLIWRKLGLTKKRGRRLSFWTFGFVVDWLDRIEDLFAEPEPPPAFPPGWWRGGCHQPPVESDNALELLDDFELHCLAVEIGFLS